MAKNDIKIVYISLIDLSKHKLIVLEQFHGHGRCGPGSTWFKVLIRHEDHVRIADLSWPHNHFKGTCSLASELQFKNNIIGQKLRPLMIDGRSQTKWNPIGPRLANL